MQDFAGNGSNTLKLPISHLDLPLKRKPGPRLPIEDSEQEMLRVIAKGGEGIDKEMKLFRNFSGNEEITLKALEPGSEKKNLITVQLHGHQSFESATAALARELSIRYGGHDAKDFIPHLNTDGSLKEVYTHFPTAEEIMARVFCDNITINVHVNVKPFYGKTGIIELLGFKSSNGRIDSEHSQKMMSAVKIGRPFRDPEDSIVKQKYKISKANLTLADVKFFYEFLRLSTRIFEGNEREALQNIYQVLEDDIDRLRLHKDSIKDAIKLGQKMYLNDMDLSIDFSGTINSYITTNRVEPLGFKPNTTHTSGSSCVKTMPRKDFGRGSDQITVMMYDKVKETMMNPGVRQKEGSKIHMLLNPSTSRLNKTFLDPEFYNNGVTR